ncbi:MAG TPA: HEAT repeat domain-containing protein [Ktedonobacteraceae bacterium]|jgi:HEAT repeat protein|nr:HEAT repeat domain-containing protein [Ktedonobacteraceae bacterium]
MEHEELQIDQHTTRQTGELSSSASILSRIHAQFGLGETRLPNNASLDIIRKALHDNDWEIRARAAFLLGQHGEESDITLLVERLQHDSSAEVRAAAARALGKLEATGAEQTLLQMLDTSEDDVRTAAAQALGDLGPQLSATAIETLEGHFYSELEEDTRAAIISALGECGERTPIQVLETALDDPEWQVREAAALAMAKQQDRAILEALEDHTNDESEVVAKAAAYALNRIVTETALRFSGIVDDTEDEDEEPENFTTEDRESGNGSSDNSGGTVLTTEPDRPPLTEVEKKGTSGNVQFKKLEPPDLENAAPVVAQAFDDQWIPRKLLHALLSGKISFQEAQRYLEYLVRTEYMRSLITSEKLIINRVFIYNNPVLYRDFLPGHAGREAFKQLLEKGVIIPFLFTETSPDESSDWIKAHHEGFNAWRQVIQEAEAQCLRFSWDNQANQEEAINQLGYRFHEFVLTAEARDVKKFLIDLGIDPKQEAAFLAQLEEMADASRKYRRTEGRHVVRTFLYQQFITEGNPTLRQYDGSKPFAGVIKQLLDLAYNSNLADALGGHLLTPIDSPTRLVLQEWESVLKSRNTITAGQLINMLKRETFQLIQQNLEGLYIRSMGLLSLPDILELRKTDEWQRYNKAMQELLRNPLQFGTLANEVSLSYVQLAQRMTRLIAERNLQHAGRLVLPWTPATRVNIHLGGKELWFTWSQHGISSNIPAHSETELKAFTRQFLDEMRMRGTRQDTICDIRLTFTDAQAGPSRARLASSIEVHKGRMPDAREQAEALIRKLAEVLKAQEFFGPQEQTATYNLPQEANA